MAKINNPFKMWGSYLGIPIFAAIVFYTPFKSFFTDNIVRFAETITGQFPYTCTKMLCGIGVDIEYVFGLIIILGFLLGWGLQELYRRFR